jgi:Tol biopolymer transport system component
LFREFFPTLSTDGHRLYFSSNRPGGFGGMDVYVSRRHNKRDDFGWQPAENLGSVVNTGGQDQPTSYFEDDVTGTITLYLQSNRPGGVGGSDIYASTLQPDETFGPPVLVEEFSSPFDDQGLTIRRDGLEVIFASNRPGSMDGSLDLWVSTRASTADPWSTPQPLVALNSAVIENRPALSFRGTELYFTSTRLGGRDPQDLWVSTRTKLKDPDDDD